ncbi:MAG: hypothetical protein ACYCPS_03470 [Candidatus Saccharimonadales bacterium]
MDDIFQPNKPEQPPDSYNNQSTVIAHSKLRKNHYIVFGLVSLILLLLLTGGVYVWQQSKINSLNRQVASLSSQITALKNNINSSQSQLKGSLSGKTIAISGDITSTYCSIPDVGFSIKVNGYNIQITNGFSSSPFLGQVTGLKLPCSNMLGHKASVYGVLVSSSAISISDSANYYVHID